MKTLILLVIVAALLVETHQESAQVDENEDISPQDDDTKEVEGSGSDMISGLEDDNNDDGDSGPDADDSKLDSNPEDEDNTISEKDDSTKEIDSENYEPSDQSSGDDGGSNANREEGDNIDSDDNTEEDSNDSDEYSASNLGSEVRDSDKDSDSGNDSDKSSASNEESDSDQSTSSKGSSSEESHEETSEEHDGCWTGWFNRDDPSGSGDWETLENLHHENPGMICKKPLRIQVKTTSEQSVSSTGGVIAFSDTSNGFGCKNSDQESECQDYEVRFLCPQEFCQVCYTQWFNRDNRGGIEDWELLCDLRAENPGQICERPLYIETQNKLTEGCGCRTCDRRSDYKVRFGCRCSV